MSAYLLVSHVVRILDLIDTAMLASEVTYVGDEQHRLKRGCPAIIHQRMFQPLTEMTTAPMIAAMKSIVATALRSCEYVAFPEVRYGYFVILPLNSSFATFVLASAEQTL